MPSGPVRRPPQELAFAAAIRAARVEAGRTQADIAQRAGLSVRVAQRAEQGLRRVSIGQAAAIAQALGRSLDELVRVSETATLEPPNITTRRSKVGPYKECARCGKCAQLSGGAPAIGRQASAAALVDDQARDRST